jgi:hypothetical protein
LRHSTPVFRGLIDMTIERRTAVCDSPLGAPFVSTLVGASANRLPKGEATNRQA